LLGWSDCLGVQKGTAIKVFMSRLMIEIATKLCPIGPGSSHILDCLTRRGRA
jgi:hypothetical protein